MRSLRVRLILLLGLAILVATAVQFTASFQAAMTEANKLSDYHMQRMALALQNSGVDQVELQTFPDVDHHGFDFVIQIWDDSGFRVYQPRSYRFLPEKAVLGYSTMKLENGEWRVYALKTQNRVIQVAQKLETRRDRAVSLAFSALWPAIPVSILLFVLAWWAVTSAFAPLNRIGRDLSNRNADSLIPVSDTGVPQEVFPLVTELNSLLVRMSHALQSQQRFVADAAHELRSPLTALKLQMQTLAKAKDEAMRVQAVTRLLGGVDRASHLVEQLLALARHEPSSKALEPSVVSLTVCVEQAVIDVSPLALSRHIKLAYGVWTKLDVQGHADSLRIMIRNVLDNAVRYTPEYGCIQIDLGIDGQGAILTIQDSGPGIPRADRGRVFDRFYRVPGTSPPGSGLGLAIVKAIAERHNAVVELGDAALGGLAVNITFAAETSSRLLISSV